MHIKLQKVIRSRFTDNRDLDQNIQILISRLSDDEYQCLASHSVQDARSNRMIHSIEMQLLSNHCNFHNSVRFKLLNISVDIKALFNY